MSNILLLSDEKMMAEHQIVSRELFRRGNTVVGAFDFSTLDPERTSSYIVCLTESMMVQFDIDKVCFHGIHRYRSSISQSVRSTASERGLAMSSVALRFGHLLGENPLRSNISLGVGIPRISLDTPYRDGVVDDRALKEGVT